MSNRTYISDLDVVYGDEPSQAPSNRVRELTGLPDDINYQFGGKYVWLVPDFTSDASSAATGFEIFIQSNPDPTKDDLAKGAGGDYRYISAIHDTQSSTRVVNVALLRTDQPSGLPEGWDGMTIDINKGRGKTYLYVIWKSVAV